LDSQQVIDDLLAATPAATWLGWSLGGQLALQAALRAPQQVQRLVLLAATPRFIAAEHWPDGMPPEQFEAFASDCARDPKATVQRFQTLVASGSRQPGSVLRLLRGLPMASRPALLDGLQQLRSTDLVAALPDIAQRALWISGEQDQVTPPAAAATAAARMPRGCSSLLRRAGHAPHLSHPGELAERVHELTRLPVR
jgi:pimeloyl-[acyl-carrier protein] methyl ester esterase